ncbi:MAG: molybdopterin cofactor-binding domain-containing protein [Bacillota bacterium]
MKTVRFKATINNRPVDLLIAPNRRLLDVLREDLGLTGTKEGCGEGECGACTVLLDGRPVNSCLVLAPEASGRRITTVEGLAEEGRLHPLQEAFLEAGAVQCGYCTPGMLLVAKALLDKHPQPDERAIKTAISGNLCRCTGYAKIVAAIRLAAARLAGGKGAQAGSGCAKEQKGPGLPVSAGLRVVGKSPPRVDGVAKVTGCARFAADLKLPGMLYARVLRSRTPHAVLRRIDAAEALTLPGVVAVYTAADIPGQNSTGIIVKDEPVLVAIGGRIRRVGDPLALVVAESEEVAEAALAKIKVEDEELPAVFSALAAISAEAPKVHGNSNVQSVTRIKKGDAEAALAKAQVVVSRRYTTQMTEHAYLETEAGVAAVENDLLTIWVSTQNPHYDRREVARVLGLGQHRVRVVQAPTGGGFGGKLDISVQCLLGLAAWKTGRPVKMSYRREESIIASPKRHPFVIDYTSACDGEGRLLAVKVRIIGDTGAYASYGPATLKRAAVHATGPYEVPNVLIESFCVYTNNPTAGAMRGFGVPQIAFAHESQMDLLAQTLGIDPFTIRLRNCLKTGSLTATGQCLEAGVGIAETIRRVREKARELKMLEK